MVGDPVETGLSIDLWHSIASWPGAPYEVREYDTFEQLVNAVTNGKLDVALALAATENHEVILDLSHPYFRSGLGLAVSRDNLENGWFRFFASAVPFPTERDGLEAIVENNIGAFVFHELVLNTS